jgi:hypothetical protein
VGFIEQPKIVFNQLNWIFDGNSNANPESKLTLLASLFQPGFFADWDRISFVRDAA